MTWRGKWRLRLLLPSEVRHHEMMTNALRHRVPRSRGYAGSWPISTIWRCQLSDEVTGPMAGSSNHGLCEGRTSWSRHWCCNYVGGSASCHHVQQTVTRLVGMRSQYQQTACRFCTSLLGGCACVVIPGLASEGHEASVWHCWWCNHSFL